VQESENKQTREGGSCDPTTNTPKKQRGEKEGHPGVVWSKQGNTLKTRKRVRGRGLGTHQTNIRNRPALDKEKGCSCFELFFVRLRRKKNKNNEK